MRGHVGHPQHFANHASRPAHVAVRCGLVVVPDRLGIYCMLGSALSRNRVTMSSGPSAGPIQTRFQMKGGRGDGTTQKRCHPAQDGRLTTLRVSGSVVSGVRIVNDDPRTARPKVLLVQTRGRHTLSRQERLDRQQRGEEVRSMLLEQTLGCDVLDEEEVASTPGWQGMLYRRLPTFVVQA